MMIVKMAHTHVDFKKNPLAFYFRIINLQSHRFPNGFKERKQEHNHVAHS